MSISESATQSTHSVTRRTLAVPFDSANLPGTSRPVTE